MRRTVTILLAVLAVAAFGASHAHAQRPGSIYDPERGPRNPITDKTARRPGDVLTVLISESQDVQNQESTDTTRESALDYQLASFNIAPNAFSVLPDLTASSSDEFRGLATVTKRGAFTARMAVLVVDVLPNGNLVVSGRREIRVDQETKLIEFTGIVRRFDVRADNTVASELVADARISYQGMGNVSHATNRRGLNRFLTEAIAWLWPF